MPFGPDDFGRGYRPDSLAQRAVDTFAPVTFAATPAHDIDLIADLGFDYPVKNQRRSSYCVRMARCSALEILGCLHQHQELVALSPLFAAWDDAMPGDQGQNVGTQLYLTAEAARVVGTCLEATHPFDNLFDPSRVMTRPPGFAYVEAERHQAVTSYRIQDGVLEPIIAALDGAFPVQIGTPIRANFWNGLNAGGVIDNTGAIQGYHSMLVVGVKQRGARWYLKLLDSWGTAGDNGYVWWPIEQVNEWQDGRVYTNVETIL